MKGGAAWRLEPDTREIRSQLMCRPGYHSYCTCHTLIETPTLAVAILATWSDGDLGALVQIHEDFQTKTILDVWQILQKMRHFERFRKVLDYISHEVD